MEKINLKTSRRVELMDITAKVQQAVDKLKVNNGVCFVFCPHTTAGLAINENADPSVKSDIINTLNKLIPPDAGYAHSEGNADSHVKSSLFGPALSIFIENGSLMLGTWQAVYFCESDGPRPREVWLKVIEEK
ncbi:MAG: secondary thiamine-phosphate synthase enzyme YjbQ [Candidatus Omnitrophica bacterium]|nr:secondary thiamine-phosphate synthase enzyme YjbQ [Candidatus Omnitrophota bacterium]MDD5027669.1 secondary thiamine-phosphate synthase enzyme YjbQ [Candidatus Omnitrophota bacterium]MDD5661591.1 secondary thiamine-phosphate synthase enzyme YjbQ [Candidatus Omnitrophota bacterium]